MNSNYKMRFSDIIFLVLFSILSLSTYSQSGKYVLSKPPREALGNFVNSDGVFELPIIVGFKTSSILLKRSKRVVIIRENNEKKKVLKGKWSINGEIVNLSIESVAKIEYKIVIYDNQSYLESVDGRQHYQKQ